MSKKSVSSSISDLKALSAEFGPHVEREIIRELFAKVDFSLEPAKQPNSAHLQVKVVSVRYSLWNCFDVFAFQVLFKLVEELIQEARFPSLVCYALDHPLAGQKSGPLRPSPALLLRICRTLRLEPIAQTAFCRALAEGSEQPELRAAAAVRFRKAVNEVAAEVTELQNDDTRNNFEVSKKTGNGLRL